ncbi:MAG: TraR/DksA family transcriptional regulator [Desulfobacterales bacterium]|nr:TraR/DksA family transcriptional regulator [Desulfobacterales bacterium]
MNKQNLTYFKKRLVQELGELLKGNDCNFDGLNDSGEVLPDILDRASNFINRSLSQNICDRETVKIRKIEQALEAMADGSYGICERCSEDIAVKRLKANPVARHCIRCRTEIETRERLTAG